MAMSDNEGRPWTAARQPTRADQAAGPNQADYEALAEFRYQIRCFLEFSQDRARGRSDPASAPGAAGDQRLWRRPAGECRRPRRKLRIRHHSAAELIVMRCDGHAIPLGWSYRLISRELGLRKNTVL